MNREQKQVTVDELKETFARVQSLILADFRGLTVQQTNELRRAFRGQACQYRVVKNTMVKRAVADTAMEGIAPLLHGPTAIAYSYDDPAAPAKVIDKFSQDLEKLQVKGGYVDGQVLDAEGVKQLAQMKGKDELRAQLLATFMAPAQSFVRLLVAAPQNFVYLLNARERSQGG